MPREEPEGPRCLGAHEIAKGFLPQLFDAPPGSYKALKGLIRAFKAPRLLAWEVQEGQGSSCQGGLESRGSMG